jgi:hypothetical protein
MDALLPQRPLCLFCIVSYGRCTESSLVRVGIDGALVDISKEPFYFLRRRKLLAWAWMLVASSLCHLGFAASSRSYLARTRGLEILVPLVGKISIIFLVSGAHCLPLPAIACLSHHTEASLATAHQKYAPQSSAQSSAEHHPRRARDREPQGCMAAERKKRDGRLLSLYNPLQGPHCRLVYHELGTRDSANHASARAP